VRGPRPRVRVTSRQAQRVERRGTESAASRGDGRELRRRGLLACALPRILVRQSAQKPPLSGARSWLNLHQRDAMLNGKMQKGRPINRPPFLLFAGQGYDFRADDLRAVDLRPAVLRPADLRVDDLRGLLVRAIDLRAVDLRAVDLRPAVLRPADLVPDRDALRAAI
jgi:hypothetical protein